MAGVEKKTGRETTAVRDQLIKDRTVARDTIKKIDAKVQGVAKEVKGALSESSKKIKASQAGLDKLAKTSENIAKQIEADRPVFNRLKDSWLHPDYYYKNIKGLKTVFLVDDLKIESFSK